MKKYLLLLVSGLVLMASCTENNAAIDFGTSASVDTTYVLTTIPATDPHNVLMEEFTGVTCTNCPAAHDLLVGLEHTYGTRLNVIGLYIYNFPQARPHHESVYDFRDSAATAIGQSVYKGIGSEPLGGVDRIPAGITPSTPLQLNTTQWTDLIVSRMNTIDSVNLQVQSSYNSTTGIATITATVIYTKPVSTTQNLSIVIVEDSVIDAQEFPPHPIGPFVDGYDPEYLFTNICRGMVTSAPFGDVILGSMTSKEAGRLFRKTYTYSKASSILRPERCRIIAFVHNATGDDYHVMQSVQTRLVP